MDKLGKTMYATADAEDLTTSGHGRIRILAEFNEPNTEVDVVEYPANDGYGWASANISSALTVAGYQIVGSITEAANGIIVPVAHRSGSR